MNHLMTDVLKAVDTVVYGGVESLKYVLQMMTQYFRIVIQAEEEFHFKLIRRQRSYGRVLSQNLWKYK